jgi:glycosyltransferase involved in cell wall biosynthesis
MRVALTVDPELPVPPRLYGGIERIVDLLARGLVEQGHELTLFAHAESNSGGTLIPWPGSDSRSLRDTTRNAAILARAVVEGKFDLVHSFSRIAYLTPILPLQIPKLMSYQRAITPRTVKLGHTLSRGTLAFTSCSEWMQREVAHIGRWHVIPNCVSLGSYIFSPSTDECAPFVFLGRIEEIKGPHIAIEVAKRTNTPLIIAGNIPPEKKQWFDSHIAPAIDGSFISYVGEVDDHQKNELLGAARALLMPILWDEPFGIVMIEAMACGTPVLGFRRGAVPDVVRHGETGFVCDTVDELVGAVERLSEIDRLACRARVQQNYSDDAVVPSYLRVYNEIARQKTR